MMKPISRAFIGRLALSMRPGDDGRRWTLDEPLSYVADDGTEIVAYSGATTDGASIPRFAWRLFGPPLAGRHAPAAVLHDALYASEAMKREACDRYFLEMLLTCGLSHPLAVAMYAAVRAGGWLVWKHHDRENVIEANKRIAINRFCLDCGGQISEWRIKARPDAVRCITCQVLKETPERTL